MDMNMDIDMNWSIGELDLSSILVKILTSSLPVHLAPHSVHRVEVVIGLHSPRPRNVDVSLVENQYVVLHLSVGVRALQ